MSREEIPNIFTSLHKDGLRFVFMQGGEPLLRRDLPDTLQDLVEIGFRLILITNGTKLISRLVQQFDDLSGSLSISLDTWIAAHTNVSGVPINFPRLPDERRC